LADLSHLRFDSDSDTPLYKQLADAVVALIENGGIRSGERLPATRELAGQLGLNRTTISAAYAVLEQSGLIEGHVGRGSFVAERHVPAVNRAPNWDEILSPSDSEVPPSSQNIEISFASSRPNREAFPLAQFRRLAKQVIDSQDAAEILQLGSPLGYFPLRRYLLAQAAADGIARPGDDLIITNGCQQALDLLARLLASGGQGIALEDPVYHGLLRAFSRAGANLIPVPVDHAGIDVDALEEAIQRNRPRLLIVTPSFQNPTGATLPLERRKRIVSLAQRFGLVLVENDIYSELRYQGKPLPTLKALDETGNTILLRSYSKVSFPGLRVGWAIAPRTVISRLADAKQISDLHSDQLSQAVLLRFAESGELEHHLERTRIAGAERLEAVLRACNQYLPHGATFTRPEGGMSLWIELPPPLTAENLLRRVQERGVDFLSNGYFSMHPANGRGLRISFGGLSPEEIRRGIQIIGETASEELTAKPAKMRFEPVPALV
jgi:2-aminoadipate transaminase